MDVWPGTAYPLGATYDGAGTNFALFSEVATRVELCLFDESGNQHCFDLPERNGFIWHGYLPDVGSGQRYGYRVHGPWEPEKGHRCNPAKLLLDPYARAVEGHPKWDEAIYPYRLGQDDLVRNDAAVPTMVGGNLTTADEVNTVLAAGRADLCLLDPRTYSGPDRPAGA